MSSLDKALNAMFDDYWGDSEPRDYQEVPNGRYPCKVVGMVLNESQSSGRLQCSWDCVILEGDHRARHIFKHDGLDTEDGVSFFKGAIGRLGHDVPESKKALFKMIDEILEGPTYLLLQVSTRKRKSQDTGEVREFSNKKIVKALDASEVTDDLTEDESTTLLSANSIDRDADAGESPGSKSKKKQRKAGDNDRPESDPSESGKEGRTSPVSLEGKLNKVERKLVLKLAKKSDSDFDPDNYDSSEELLCDLADYHGLTGRYVEPAKLIRRVVKAIRSQQNE